MNPNAQNLCIDGIKRTYVSIFCARNFYDSTKQKQNGHHNPWQKQFIRGRGAAEVSEKGSVVCKNVMASLTLDIHQSY